MFNLGIGGNTSRALKARIKNELEARHRPDWPPIVIIGVGANDTRYSEEKGVFTPIEEYRENIKEVIKIAREYTDKILIVGIALVKNDNQLFKGTSLSFDRLKEYDQILSEIADQEGLPKVDAMSALKAEHDGIFYKDNIHLNDRGHELLSEAVWDKLEKLLV
jgi:lysophospholipase L1-like esterase